MIRSRAALACACVLFLAAWMWLAATGPAVLPGHFDGSGTVTRWAGKWSLLAPIGALGVVLAAVFGCAHPVLSRVPADAVNLPSPQAHRYWTAPERRDEFDRRVASDLEWIGAATLALLASLLMVVGSTTTGAVSPWALAGPTAVYLVTVLGYSGYVVCGPRYRVPH